MNEKQKQALKLRSEGYSLQEIADTMECSKQNVSKLLEHGITEKQYCGKLRKTDVIYPNIKQWLIDNGLSVGTFAKKCGYSTPMPVRNCIIYGKNVNKRIIDTILKTTGMTYEQAFYKESEKG